MGYIFYWFNSLLPFNENTVMIYGLGHLLCIILAGRRYYQDTGKSTGYLIGFIGPLGVVIVYFFPQILNIHQNKDGIGFFLPFHFYVRRPNSISEDLLMDKKGTYDSEDLLKMDTVGATIGLDEIKNRKVNSGFKKSSFYMPVAGGFVFTMLVCAILYGLGLFMPFISNALGIKRPEVSFMFQFQYGIIFVLYISLFVIALTNHRTLVICPRCGNQHVIASKFEGYLGITGDFDPSENGCKYCDYLPSRDRVIIVE